MRRTLVTTLVALLVLALASPAQAGERVPPPDLEGSADFTFNLDGTVTFTRLDGCDAAEYEPSLLDAAATPASSGVKVSCFGDVEPVWDLSGEGYWRPLCKSVATLFIFGVGLGQATAYCGPVFSTCFVVSGGCTAAAAGVPPGGCDVRIYVLIGWAWGSCGVTISWQWVSVI